MANQDTKCYDCQNLRLEGFGSGKKIGYNQFCDAPEAAQIETDPKSRFCSYIRGREIGNLASMIQDCSVCNYARPLEQSKWRKVFIFWPRKIEGTWHFLETVEGRKVNELVVRRSHLLGESANLESHWEYRQVTTVDDENGVSLG